MAKSKDFGLLYKFNFPPYQVIYYSNNCFIVCGGGGAAKTGVPNKIELYELTEVNGHDQLAVPILKNKSSFDTGVKAIMSIRKHFNYLLTAEGNDLREYILCEKVNDEANLDEQEIEAVIKDRRKSQEKEVLKINEFELKLHRKLGSCFSVNEDDFEVNVVRYCDKSGHLIVAGSSNGVVRVYQRYSDEKPMDLVLQKEFQDVTTKRLAVMDLDVAPNLDEIVTVASHPDGKYARIWSISRGVKVTELALMDPKGKKLHVEGCSYKFKQCRYASAFIIGRPTLLLYATHQPAINNKKMSSFMSVWGPLDPNVGTDYQLVDVVPLGNNKTSFGVPASKLVPTALCTSQCGLMAAIGSGEGQVDVFRLGGHQVHQLTRIYSLQQAHSFFVTDLTFLPSARAFKTGHQFELLSVGVDNMLRYHRRQHKPTYLRLERIYKLLSLLIVILFCDRFLLFLSLF